MASSRVYIGKLPQDVRRSDIDELFKGYGRVLDVKLMGAYGFCEFEDPRDAEDVVKNCDGADLLGNKILVQMAKDNRRSRDPYGYPPRGGYPGYGPPGYPDPYGYGPHPGYGRPAPRIRRGNHRVIISNLPPNTSWQDLKDIGRECGQISFADVDPTRPDEGILEYSNRDDMERALDKIEGLELRGSKLRADPAPEGPPPPPMSGRGAMGPGGPPPPRDYGSPYGDPYGPPPPRGGPGPRGGYGGGYDDRYGPPPHHRDDRDRYGPPPPRGGDPRDRDFSPPPRRRSDDDVRRRDDRDRSPPPRRERD